MQYQTRQLQGNQPRNNNFQTVTRYHINGSVKLSKNILLTVYVNILLVCSIPEQEIKYFLKENFKFSYNVFRVNLVEVL